MEILERTVILPENQSFIIKETALKNNKGVIHTHDKYELNFIIDAYGRRFVSGNISKFIPGDLIFMAPGVPHCWEIDNKEMDPKAITIYFLKDFLEHSILNIPELGFVHNLIKKSIHGLYIRGFDPVKLINLFNVLLNRDNKFENMLEIIKLLKNIAGADDIQMLASNEFSWDTDLPQNQRLKIIYEYVFHNFQKCISLEEVSSLIGLSEGAFCAFFKKSTKKTFSAFIKEVKVGYACKMLNQDTDRPISQICFESGYNNFANFNRQFKEITKISPKQFRVLSKA